MPEPITCRLVTPSAELLSEAVVYAKVPMHDGLIGVQHGSAPLVARLGLGTLTLDFPSEAGSGSRSYFIDGGFIKMAHNELVILAEKAEAAESIVESEARAALSEAEARVIPQDAEDRYEAAERLRHEQDAARLRVRLAGKAKNDGI